MIIKNQLNISFFTFFSLLVFTSIPAISSVPSIFDQKNFAKPLKKKPIKRSSQSRETFRGLPDMQLNIVTALTLAKIPAVLDNALYKKTHPVQFRNIVQYPIFLPSSTNTKTSNWKCDFFFNQAFAKDFTETDTIDSRKVSAYINLENQTLIGAFNSAKDTISGIINFDDFSVPDLFNIFSPMKLQEHRLGAVGQYHKRWGNVIIDVKLPFLWAERNFNFTKKEKEQIYNNEFLLRFGMIDEWEFAKKYMISDQLGFGTLETTFSTYMVENDAGGIEIGLTLYFPTEFAVKKGLLGTYREVIDERPILDFMSLIHEPAGVTTVATGWEDTISKYFEGAFTRFTANILQLPLGFDHHPGIALHISPTWNINHRWTWKSFYSTEIFIPMYQNRLITEFLHGKTDVSDGYNAIDPTFYEEKIKFIQEILSDRLYPKLSRSLIMPGVIFQSSSCFHYAKGSKTFSFGYDNWIQLREQIYSHSLDQTTIWNIAAAEKPLASQFKLFGRVEKIIQRESHDLTLGFYIDWTTFSHAIGRDFLINFEIKGKF